MFDLVIRGDCVVTPHGVDAHDIAVQDEKIVAVADALVRALNCSGVAISASMPCDANLARTSSV